MAKKRILVLSPNIWDVEELARPRYAQEYEFVFFDAGFYDRHVLLTGLTFDIFGSIARAIEAGRRARVDGVIGTNDYPASLQAAAVAAALGLPGPSVASALVCHHKYLCRQIQQRAVPEAVPRFGLIDPFAFSEHHLPLPFPFFVKPVKGTLSLRAARVDDFRALTSTLAFSPLEKVAARALVRPFNQMVAAYTGSDIRADAFIAEDVLHGEHQVTVEGFIHERRVEVMGIVDSIMYPGTRSFQRFEYPSQLPGAVQDTMRAIAARVVEATGFDNACFNVELMYDADRDLVSVIELNPRMCTQFSDLYEKVDGTSGYDVQLAVATGHRPEFHARQGRDRVAGSFVLRTFQNRKVTRLPASGRLTAIQRRRPGTVVKLLCREGRWLSEQPQDMTSYRYAIVNIGARTVAELHAAFAEARDLLTFQFADGPSFTDMLPRFHVSPRQRPLAT